MDASDATTGDVDLDVWKDLRFLLASDDGLHDDLTHVCALLDTSSAEDDPHQVSVDASSSLEQSSTSSTASTATEGKKRKLSKKDLPPRTDLKNAYESRQKHELYALRLQVEALRADLDRRQTAASSTVAVRSFSWQTTAREEFTARNQSLRENAQLREAVDDNATFIDRMQVLLRLKKPRLLPPEQLDWQSLKLAAHSSLRTAAMHAIADRQLRRLQSALIQAHVFERTDDVFDTSATLIAKGRVKIQVVEQVTLPAPCAAIGAAVWAVFGGARQPALPPTASETLEEIESDDGPSSSCTTTTMYATYKEVSPDTNLPVYSNVIRKRYRFEKKDVVVWRSVKEDARMPHTMDGPTEDEAGWCQAVPVEGNPRQCRLTVVLQYIIDYTQRFVEEEVQAAPPSVESITTLMDKFSFVQPPPRPGMVHAAPMAPAIDVTTTPTPSKGAFFYKAKRFEVALKDSVRDAIAAVNAQSQPPASL